MVRATGEDAKSGEEVYLALGATRNAETQYRSVHAFAASLEGWRLTTAVVDARVHECD